LPGAAFINIISAVAFKQNLPLLAVVLAVGGVAGTVLFLQPPPEDRLRKAVTAHAAALPGVQGFDLFGAVADFRRADGTVLHLEFAEKQGEWAFSKDVGKEFAEILQSPSTQEKILNRLAQRLANRFNAEVRVKEGVKYEHLLLREADGRLRGTVTVGFAYPNPEKRGKYIETWRYEDGRWSNSGIGSLFDFAGSAPTR
jgi:hypothetical protein